MQKERQKMNIRVKYRSLGVLIFIVMATGLKAITVAAENTEFLTDIEVVGNQKQTKETVLLKSGLRGDGCSLSDIDLTEALNKLWATDLYDDIKFEVACLETGKKIIVRLQERPTIKEVLYTGGKKIDISTIKKNIKESGLTISTNATYNLESVRKIKNIITDIASDKGFLNARVNVTTKQIGPATAQLIFDIKEGSITKFQQIIFDGNKTIDTAKLRSLIKGTRKSWFWSSNTLIKKDIHEGIEKIKREYWKMGYKDVSVGEPVIYTMTPTLNNQKGRRVEIDAKENNFQRNQDARLTVPIVEGEYFSKGTFIVEGDDKDANAKKIESLYRRALSSEQSIEDSLPKKMNHFDLYAVNKAIDDILTNYNEQGYLTCHIQKKLEVVDGPDGKAVDVVFNINKGEQFKLHHINFEGNIKTKDKVLRRSMIIDEGDVFNKDKIIASMTKLSQLGHFKVKDNKCEPLANTPGLDFTVSGEESGNNNITLKGGYGSSQGFGIGGSVSTDNLYGNGQSLKIDFDTSVSNRVLSIEYTEPFFRDTPYSLTTSILSESINSKRLKTGIATDTGKRLNKGIAISGRTKLSTFLPDHNWADFTSCSVGYQFRAVKITDTESCHHIYDTDWHRRSSLIQDLTYDTTDHPFRPTSGKRTTVKFEYSGRQFSKDTPFFKVDWHYHKLVKITDRNTFGFYVDYGHIKIQKTDKKYHGLGILYKPGGEDSIRGYDRNSVGPGETEASGKYMFMGGNKQFVVTLEHQIRFTDVLQLIIFHDLGQAWEVGKSIFDNYKKSDTSYEWLPRASIGIELRLFTPISPAPIRLIWSRKLRKDLRDASQQSNFRFSIGTNF